MSSFLMFVLLRIFNYWYIRAHCTSDQVCIFNRFFKRVSSFSFYTNIGKRKIIFIIQLLYHLECMKSSVHRISYTTLYLRASTALGREYIKYYFELCLNFKLHRKKEVSYVVCGRLCLNN